MMSDPEIEPEMTQDEDNQAAQARLEHIFDLTVNLTHRLAIECQAFEANRPLDVAQTLPETTRLANLYRHESRQLREAPQILAGTSREDRIRLIQATEAFDAVLARHGRAIEAAKYVTEGVVRAIAHEVAASRCTGAGYGPSAQQPPPPSTALTLNQSA
jgi:hypothetical protein